MGEPITAGDVELWVERRGEGPDVLLIAGLSDPAEAWQFQLEGLADRYRLIAFDNRGAGRTPLPAGALSVPGAGAQASAAPHQPFQEAPDDFNTRVDSFWRAVDGRG